MSWTTTGDIREFVAVAGRFLEADPVGNTVLLTEAAHLSARQSDAHDQQYGWWRDEAGDVAGAFLQAPRHAPILSPLTEDALVGLAEALPGLDAVGVDARGADAAIAAWAHVGVRLGMRSRIGLHRLERPGRPVRSSGVARTAVAADRDLLVTWFEQLMAASPGDPSDREYVVDDPLEYGGITLWEVDRIPSAMAGRSRLAAGMVRVGAVFEVEPGAGHGDAALAQCAATSRTLAEHVLLFVGSDDQRGADLARHLGFDHVLDRVMLVRS